MITNICSDKLTESKDFYTKLFNFEINYDSDWFIHLTSKDKNLELGIIKRTNEIVPKEIQQPPQGFYITLVVENVEEIFELAKTEKITILSEPSDTFYGQRRMLLKDPNEAWVDVSSPIPVSGE
jgi:predicted enzyme related to lactoylglutathione lyase